jgi:hypothetical protein
LEDDDFYDQHHVVQSGADNFTRRFEAEVLKPLLAAPRVTSRPSNP